MRIIEYRPEPEKKKETRFDEWKGEKILERHSWEKAVDEIVELNDDLDAVKIGLVGKSGAGKTTMFDALAHSIRVKSLERFGRDYTVVKLDENDLADFEGTIERLPEDNLIILFDDVSFSFEKMNKKQASMVKGGVTKVRHLAGRQDKKVIMVYVTHYSLGQDKFVRNYEYTFVFSVGSSEMDNMAQMFGAKYKRRLQAFSKNVERARKTRKFPVGDEFVYTWKKPFIMLLFYNGDELRLVVSPTHEWLEKGCNCCDYKMEPSKEKVEKYWMDATQKFGGNLKIGVKAVAHARGLENVYSKAIMAVIRNVNVQKFRREEIVMLLEKWNGDSNE